jgi:hypothetical protein
LEIDKIFQNVVKRLGYFIQENITKIY